MIFAQPLATRMAAMTAVKKGPVSVMATFAVTMKF
jgi:hypothetical protein